MRLTLLLAAAVVSGFAGAALRPEPTVRAQSFILVDEKDNKRAELTLRNGEAILRFYDAEGQAVWAAPPRLQILPAR